VWTGAGQRLNKWPKFCCMTVYHTAIDTGLLILRVVLGLTLAATVTTSSSVPAASRARRAGSTAWA
jgi:hypothetical protein